MSKSSRLKSLLQTWQHHDGEMRYEKSFNIYLPVHVAARIMALAELYPGRSVEQIICDVLATALEEIEESMPYVQGSRVICQDEFGDDIYEDIGMSARFQETTTKYLRELKKH